jgi:hypothetical protein
MDDVARQRPAQRLVRNLAVDLKRTDSAVCRAA